MTDHLTTGFRTKKAARQAGYLSEKDMQDGLCPRLGAKPVVIKGEEFWTKEDCEPLLNKSDARRAGLRIPDGLKPLRWKSWRYGTFGLWRKSELLHVIRRPSRPSELVDLLAAIFAVNRSAKRYRNAASSCYSWPHTGWRKQRNCRRKHSTVSRIEG